ncbi:MAG: BON domain-containing protein [Acidobacteria bacterium]|nr:BON domain-containing protein [Acidobacteriota bacterium]
MGKFESILTFACFALLLALVVSPLAAQKAVSDDEIYDAVRRRLANDPDVRGGALEVEVSQGLVTLKGVVEIEKHKTKAEKLAKKVNGVKQVRNELQVARKDAR